MAVNLLETAIQTVSPAWAASRAMARARLAQSEMVAEKVRGFNAVSKGRRAGDTWTALGDGDPTESASVLSDLRKLGRELSRNNPYFVKAISVIVGDTVAHGIRASISDPAKTRQPILQARWDRWAKSKTPDATGKLNFYGLQSLALRTIVESGEVLIQKIVQRGELRLRLIPPEFLASSMDVDRMDGSGIHGGVEYDRLGVPVAYHLHRVHPARGGHSIVRVDARDIVHAYRMERAGQIRGIPWVAPVYTRLRDWDGFEDAELLRQRLAACYTAFVRGAEGLESDAPSDIEPGRVEYLPPGSEVTLSAPPSAAGIRDSSTVFLRGIAAGFGITYEALTGDYSNVNFSSARMGSIQAGRNVRDYQEHIVIEQMLDVVFGWWAEVEALRGFNTAHARVSWTVPARVQIDPVKETAADLKQVRAGFASWSDVVRRSGRDPHEVADQIAEDNERFDKLGIVLDSDPRKVSNQGQGFTNQKPPEDTDGDTPD